MTAKQRSLENPASYWLDKRKLEYAGATKEHN